MEPLGDFCAVAVALLLGQSTFFTAADDVGDELYLSALADRLLCKEYPVADKTVVLAVGAVAEQIAPDETALVVKGGHEEVYHSGAGWLYGGVALLPLLAIMVVAANNDIGCRMMGINLTEYIVVKKTVAGVHEVQIVACRLYNPFVHCVVDAIVALGDPVGYLAVVRLQHLGTAIGGTSVNDDEFEVTVGLANDALDGTAQPFSVVVVDSDNGILHLL